ncbi:MAG: DNA alkylation repair protein, partial [Planctomycetes bacterium]|nr:DNA alkylation repair protein [Planctomycetota bacterium]
SEATFLGADEPEIATAAGELVENFPQMGRAQMTAFVRTLWASGIYELQAVGTRVLAARAELLEPADLPFVEDLLQKCDVDELARTLADEALGALASKSKKVWRDLKKMSTGKDMRLRRAAVRSCRLPVHADEAMLPRFVEIVEPMLEAGDDEQLLATVDEVLAALAAEHSTAVADAVRDLAEQHGREIASAGKKAKGKR